MIAFNAKGRKLLVIFQTTNFSEKSAIELKADCATPKHAKMLATLLNGYYENAVLITREEEYEQGYTAGRAKRKKKNVGDMDMSLSHALTRHEVL